jgi:putative ABC transport system ATP-binding protein
MTHINKSYRTEHIETRALRDFSLRVQRGEFVAVMGPSGSGKTTFLNVAGLLESFDSGRYEIEGRDASALSDRARSRLRNEKIGFIFQNFNLLADLDVSENVEVPLRYRGLKRAERHTRIAQALELVGLAGRAQHYPSQLSGGQQQRVAIARALAGEPSFLLADEPTGNLDSEMARHVMDLLEQVHRMGTTLIMVTHDAQLATRADRVIRIVDGTLSPGVPAGHTVAEHAADGPARASAGPGGAA